jgi:NAD(P)-dependent dehydrogenase (short-subunit alcohol dehydrogenase family)
MNRRKFLKFSTLCAFPFAANAATETQKPFQNKTIVITGATSGIGETTARTFATAGAHVYFCGRRGERGRNIEGSIRQAGGLATFIRCDVREEKQVHSFFDSVVQKSGRIDVAFLNAGIAPKPAPLHEASTDTFFDLINTHIAGTFYCVRKVLPVMMKQNSGIIIVSSSIGTKKVISGESLYSSSKLALNSFIRHIAIDYQKHNIRCIGIEPVGVRTEMLERRAKHLGIPLDKIGNPFNGRQVDPKEVAELVMTVSSGNTARLINGTILDLSEGGTSSWLISRKCETT